VRVTRVSISLEKRANDGEYGSEKSEVELFADLELGDEVHECLESLMATARLEVERDLVQSPNLKVRRSMIREVRRCNRCEQLLDDAERGYMHPACKLAEDAEREERYQEMKRQRQRENEETAGDEVEEIEGENADELEDIPL
jgi:hypothetical protein